MRTIRVSLPTYNALTDNTPDHFALYTDETWVLIKEFHRGSISATSSHGVAFHHGLGYIPAMFCFYQDGNIWKEVTGQLFEPFTSQSFPTVVLDANSVYFFGNDPSTPTNFKFYIFYDQQL